MTATTVTPQSSSVPSTDVSHGPRSGLRQKPGRNGGKGGGFTRQDATSEIERAA